MKCHSWLYHIEDMCRAQWLHNYCHLLFFFYFMFFLTYELTLNFMGGYISLCDIVLCHFNVHWTEIKMEKTLVMGNYYYFFFYIISVIGFLKQNNYMYHFRYLNNLNRIVKYLYNYNLFWHYFGEAFLIICRNFNFLGL